MTDMTVHFCTDGAGRPVTIEAGKTYVLETAQRMTYDRAQAILAHLKAAEPDAKFLLLTEGIHLVREQVEP